MSVLVQNELGRDEVGREPAPPRFAAVPWVLRPASGALRTAPLWAGQRPPGTLDAWLGQIHEDDRRRVELELMTHTQGLSDRVESAYRVIAGGGGERWVGLWGTLGADGQLVGSQRDITRERALAAALAASEARFQQVLARSPDASMVHRSGRLLYVNPAALRLLGWEGEEGLLGGPLLRCVYGEDIEALCRQVRAVIGGAECPEPLSLRLLHRDGHPVPVEVIALRIDGAGGPAVLTQARGTAARQRRQARRAHADRMNTLGSLAAGVAHEINNPLMSMDLNLRAVAAELPRVIARLRELEARCGGGGALESLGELELQIEESLSGARRIREVVSDLRSFSQDSGEPPGPVSLSGVIELAVALCRHECAGRARVVTEVQDGTWVIGHEGRLSQVFFNLVVNAAQAIVEGEPWDHVIRLDARREEGRALIRVSDTGPGIPAEHMQRLFEPGFTTRHPGLGTGLGLAICRYIIEGYGGGVEVDSAPGRGTCVTVWLPLAEPAGEASRGPRRPRARRFPGRGLRGVLEDPERVWEIAVVDYSASGLRLRGPGLEALARDGRPLTAVLRAPGEARFVRLRLGYVREVARASSVDLCFEVRELGAGSRTIYSAWLARAAQRDPGSSSTAL